MPDPENIYGFDLDKDSPAYAQRALDHQVAIAAASDLAAIAGRVTLPVVPPDRVLAEGGEVIDLGNYQTPIRSQQGRDTCYTFAALAAMEAAYRRLGVILDLSEQYVFHINKSFRMDPDYLTSMWGRENNSSMTGFQGSSGMVGLLARYAVPEESDAPYLSDTQMTAIANTIPAGPAPDMGGPGLSDPNVDSAQETVDALEYDERHVPMAARTRARYKVREWFQVPTSADRATMDGHVKDVLRAGYEVVADIKDHCWLIVGFDDGRQEWIVKNSNGGAGLIRSSYTAPGRTVSSAHYIVSVEPAEAAPQMRDFWIGPWQHDHDGHVGRLVIRRYTDVNHGVDEPTKLGSYYRDGRRYDVNGTISLDGRVMDYWIADTTARVAPGSERGQHFTVSMFATGDHAAGVTTWDGQAYGTRLDRLPRAITPRQGFTADWWLDSWTMDLDGRYGVLRIQNLDPLLATWESQPDKQQLQVTGFVDHDAPQRLSIRIYFHEGVPTDIDLFCHTWEDGTFSGRSQWRGTSYGVVGSRFQEPVYPPFAAPDAKTEASMLYAVEPDGDLRWYRHDRQPAPARDDALRGPRVVGRGWGAARFVLPAGGDAIYVVDPDGTLRWFRHLGFNQGLTVDEAGGWQAGRTPVGEGWADFAHVFGGGDGVLYAITADGTLRWHHHLGVETGAPDWAEPHDVGVGWGGLQHVFSTGGGAIYTIADDGILRWYRHVGFGTGAGLETPGSWIGPREVGTGWAGLRSVFAAANGVIFTVDDLGRLAWYRHLGWSDGRGLDSPDAWQGRREVGTGWSQLTHAFALLPRAAGGLR